MVRLAAARFLVPLLVLAVLGAASCSGRDAAVDREPPPAAAPDPTEPQTTSAEPTAAPTTAPITEAPPVAGAPRASLPRPLRAVWIHLFDGSLKSAAGMDQVLDDAEAAGLDAVFVQVVRRHDAYYESGVLPRTPDPGLEPGFDVLAAAVEGGHRRGLQVHAWFTVATAWHPEYDDLELPPGHVTREHGPATAEPWMTVSRTGDRSTEYFDIGLPEVHDHVAAIVGDIGSRYEVDGVHLDYVRYDGADWGYHPRALQRFAAETGQAGVPDAADAAWSEWRRNQSRAIVERARVALDEVRPQALLSAAVIAQGAGPASAPGGFAGTRAWVEHHQDWPAWVDDGLLDLAIPMVYFREHDAAQARWFREWVDFGAELDAGRPDVAVAVGVGGWLNTVPAGLAQVRTALDRTAGVVVFSYQQDSSDAPRGALLAELAGG